MASPTDSPADRSTVDSTWWYWIVITPLFAGTILMFMLGLSATIVFGASTDLSVFFPAFFVLGLLAVVFAIAFPSALYLDIAALDEAEIEWEPTGIHYVLAAAVSVASGFILAIPLTVYYLYRRHESVGVP